MKGSRFVIRRVKFTLGGFITFGRSLPNFGFKINFKVKRIAAAVKIKTPVKNPAVQSKIGIFKYRDKGARVLLSYIWPTILLHLVFPFIYELIIKFLRSIFNPSATLVAKSFEILTRYFKESILVPEFPVNFNKPRWQSDLMVV